MYKSSYRVPTLSTIYLLFWIVNSSMKGLNDTASVSKRKDGSYYFREYCGMINGKRVNRYMTWRPEPGMTQNRLTEN